MNIKILNFVIAIVIIICNIPLIIVNFDIIRNQGGPMGIGLIASPILLICNLFLIPAFLSFVAKFNYSKTILFLNILGIICCGFLAFLLLTTPKID